MYLIIILAALVHGANSACPVGTACRDDTAADGATKFSHISTDRQPGKMLNTSEAPLETSEVKHEQVCVFKCVKNVDCNSLNYDESTKQCQLFDVAEFSKVGEILDNETSIHHEVIGVCSNRPCLNNASCLPNNAAGSYTCTCPNARITGTNCETVARFSQFHVGSIADGSKMNTFWKYMLNPTGGSACETSSAMSQSATQGTYSVVYFIPPITGKYVFTLSGYTEQCLHITTPGKQDRRNILYKDNLSSTLKTSSTPVTLEQGKKIILETSNWAKSSFPTSFAQVLGLILSNGVTYDVAADFPPKYLQVYQMSQI